VDDATPDVESVMDCGNNEGSELISTTLGGCFNILRTYHTVPLTSLKALESFLRARCLVALRNGFRVAGGGESIL
jgi:hypothetical protein